jgi:hypothetical protein
VSPRPQESLYLFLGFARHSSQCRWKPCSVLNAAPHVLQIRSQIRPALTLKPEPGTGLAWPGTVPVSRTTPGSRVRYLPHRGEAERRH